jgi:hypothetical protein
LTCEHEHPFEGWFGSSADYDDQHGRGLLDCPICGSKAVRKAIMAPAVVGGKAQADPPSPSPEAVHEMAMQAAVQVRKQIEDNFDYVGDDFAKEARAIHEGKAEERGIYGEATAAEVKALVDDGVPVAALPPMPKDKNDLN